METWGGSLAPKQNPINFISKPSTIPTEKDVVSCHFERRTILLGSSTMCMPSPFSGKGGLGGCHRWDSSKTLGLSRCEATKWRSWAAHAQSFIYPFFRDHIPYVLYVLTLEHHSTFCSTLPGQSAEHKVARCWTECRLLQLSTWPSSSQDTIDSELNYSNFERFGIRHTTIKQQRMKGEEPRRRPQTKFTIILWSRAAPSWSWVGLIRHTSEPFWLPQHSLKCSVTGNWSGQPLINFCFRGGNTRGGDGPLWEVDEYPTCLKFW